MRAGERFWNRDGELCFVVEVDEDGTPTLLEVEVDSTW